MSETHGSLPLDSGELSERLHALRARFDELRGRL
jgi:hypothetical protein